MLPSDLLRVKISGGRIRPVYAAMNPDSLALAERMVSLYREGVGKRKGELLEKLTVVENDGPDFKLVRGLSTLLERRATFQAEGAVDPIAARRAVFKEASKARASSREETAKVLRTVSTQFGVSPAALEKALFCDIDDELILKEFRPPAPDALLRQYNLSVTQTLLFKSLRVEFTASGNWKNIFRDVKWLGLIYSVEKSGEQFRVSLDGPLSLFKMTERYGTSIAKLLQQITAADSWTVKAEILSRSAGGKVYNFEAESGELNGVIAKAGGGRWAEDTEQAAPPFDSSTEERFAKSFLSYGTGWTLRREPEPLVAGTQVLIPDFSFEREGMKVYLEVVGFWTDEYLERKVAKLNLATAGVDMIIAVDEDLACSKVERLRGKALVVYYRGKVPLKPIIDHLREKDAALVKKQVDTLKGELPSLRGNVVSIEELAKQRGVSTASMRAALNDFRPEGYVRAGDRFVSREKLAEIDGKLGGVERLVDALAIIEAAGVKEEGGKVLEALGYSSIWDGLEMDRVRISKTK